MSFDATQALEEVLNSTAEALDQADIFFGHGTDNAWDEACWLLETLMQRNSQSAFLPETIVPVKVLEELQTLLSLRTQQNIPMAYLLKEAWFAGRAFYVDERVIIPRSPFAELILNDFEPLLGEAPKSILDLCCGSGCIGIAAALSFPQAELLLSDLSTEALEVAKINVARHALQDRTELVQSDLFQHLDQRFDLIISNPPYVGEDEYRALPAEYKQEPTLALLSEQNGLDIPSRILRQAAGHLNEGGLLVLEVGNSWEALQSRYPEAPFLWLDFEQGGEGICALSKAQLQQYQF